MKSENINYENEEKYKEEEKKQSGKFGGEAAGEASRIIVGSRDRSGVFENQADIWLTTKEAAEHLRISSKSLLNLTSNGGIRYYKFGRRNRFLLSDLNRALLAQARGGSYGY